MSGEKGIRAPYNFVPFHTKGSSGAAGSAQKGRVEKVLVRYQNIENIPRHDIIDPALKTGEIHVIMRAETPVFVSDGHKQKVGDKTVDDPHFFRGANGQFMLPGSTIRGMVRENMQILGFGLVSPGEDLEDYQVYFREMSAARGSAGDSLKQYYRGVLGIETGRDDRGRSYSIPRRVEAGYLRCDGSGYYIQPTKAPYIRVPKGSSALAQAGLSDGYAKTVKVAYVAKDSRLDAIRPSDRPVDGMEQGVLLYTGMPIGGGKDSKKHNARYLFPAADEDAIRVDISKEDELSYRIDWEDRVNFLKAYYDPRFWALPEEGEEKPVFYVRHDGHTYFGMSLFLRIGYSHRFSDGLPAPDPKIARREGSIPLDYVHGMLGFAGKEHSYRSRVSFGDFSAEGDPEECPAVQTILGQPKPSWYAGYVEDGKHYNENEFYLRGYKLYWLKDAGAVPVPEGKEKVGSTLRPLPEGTVFRGVIRYKNLHPDELGLLLWALRLEDGCCQSVGMGKPYGFGRMKLTIDQLLEYDVGALYAPDSLCKLPASGNQDNIERYIKRYDSYAWEALHIKKPSKKAPTVGSEDTIKDFFYMRRAVRGRDEVSYMELPKYKNMMGVLPAVQEIREAAEADVQRAAAVPSDDMDALLKALKDKYNTR